MAVLTGFTLPVGRAGPDFAPHIAAVTGLVVTDATVRSPTRENDAVVIGEITESNRAAIQAAIASYTYNPDWGVPQESRDLMALRTKAQAVVGQGEAFSAPQIHRALAALILRAEG